MNDDQILQRLRETSWRRKLTNAEAAELRAWLAAHPEARTDWDADEHLNAALRGLKNEPVASNFTARVLQAVGREEEGGGKIRVATVKRWRLLPVWLPKAAVVTAVCGAGLLLYQHQRATQRQELAHSVAVLSGMQGVPDMDILQDFDVIRRLGRTPPPDEELLALLQ